MRTILLLLISNIFMVFAWYGHLKFKTAPLLLVVLASWGIAFFEYCFMVPANRLGHGQFTTIQLKVIQEVLTLLVFGVFVISYMGEPLRWNHLVSFAFLVAAVYFVFGFGDQVEPTAPPAAEEAIAVTEVVVPPGGAIIPAAHWDDPSRAAEPAVVPPSSATPGTGSRTTAGSSPHQAD